jgi:hypothetical protein
MIESLQISLLNKGIYSVPVTNDVFNITTGVTTYQHSISSRGGCESATINIDAPLETAIQYLDCVLRHVRVFDQYAQQIWGGYVNRVTVDYGSSTTSIGLENFASRYIMYNNNAVSATLFDANVASTYCDKLRVVTPYATATTPVARTAILTQQLTLYGAPQVETRTTSETRSSQRCQVTLECLGYYSITNWTATAVAITPAVATDTATLINQWVTASIANNAYFKIGSTLLTTGVNVDNTSTWQAYTTYNQLLDDAYNAGTSTGQILSYGVDPNGFYSLQLSAINDKTIHYVKSVGSSKIYSPAGNEIPPTQILPDRNIAIQELKPIFYINSPTAYPGYSYVDRVSLQIDRNGYQLILEPSALNDAMYDIARLRKGKKFQISSR